MKLNLIQFITLPFALTGLYYGWFTWPVVVLVYLSSSEVWFDTSKR